MRVHSFGLWHIIFSFLIHTFACAMHNSLSTISQVEINVGNCAADCRRSVCVYVSASGVRVAIHWFKIKIKMRVRSIYCCVGCYVLLLWLQNFCQLIIYSPFYFPFFFFYPSYLSISLERGRIKGHSDSVVWVHFFVSYRLLLLL